MSRLGGRLAIAGLLGWIAMAAPMGPHRTAPVWAAQDDEERFLTLEQAPGAVFPEADSIERRDVAVSPSLRAAVERRMAGARPSLWEEVFVTFTARRNGVLLGHAVVLEEIGKHRPITSIVAVRPDGAVHDTAVMVYREGYGGEVRQRRFLDQYPGISPDQPLAGRIRNIAGATLSVEALNRTVRKGLAVVDVLFLHPEPSPTARP